MVGITLTARQVEIIKLVKQHAPITGDQLAEMLGTGKPTLRADLSLLVMLRLLEAKPRVGYFPGTAAEQGRERMFKRWEEASVKDVQGLPISVSETASVHDAVITLFMGNAEVLTVVDENRHFVGIVTPKELLKVTLGSNAASIPVSMAMSRLPAIAAVQADQPLLQAVKKMLVQELDGLPVVSGEEQPGRRSEVTGWISKTNILRWMMEQETDRRD
ncbi:CBS domain-containing protein [Paenibacillus silvisoli]|uniref:CBS domain-containing protein n=1 Tax=Paenibacillus silvisoli TaxID=3110539 RepID=UPI0028058701|nr:CBS domain-containing protein [Paenibacillus silvisoli]